MHRVRAAACRPLPAFVFLLLVACGSPSCTEPPRPSGAPPFDVSAFEAVMSGPDAARRMDALEDLLAASEPPPATLPTLAAALADENRWVRDRAVQAIARFGSEAAPALPALVRALRDPDGFVRWRAAKALAGMGAVAEPATEELERMASASDETELGRHWSARALEQIRVD